MTQNIGSTALSDDPPSPSERLREVANDRRVLALVGAVAVALIAIVAFVVVPALTGGSGQSAAVITAGHQVSTVGTTSTSPTTTVSPTPSTYGLHDPLQPLVAAAAAGGGGVAPVGSGGVLISPAASSTSESTVPAPVVAALTPGFSIPAPSTSAAAPVATPTSATATPTSSAATPTPSSAAPAPGTLTEITLKKINFDASRTPTTATVDVNGIDYAAQLNIPFGKGFVMTALTDKNVTVYYNKQTATIVPGEFALYQG